MERKRPYNKTTTKFDFFQSFCDDGEEVSSYLMKTVTGTIFNEPRRVSKKDETALSYTPRRIRQLKSQCSKKIIWT